MSRPRASGGAKRRKSDGGVLPTGQAAIKGWSKRHRLVKVSIFRLIFLSLLPLPLLFSFLELKGREKMPNSRTK